MLYIGQTLVFVNVPTNSHKNSTHCRLSSIHPNTACILYTVQCKLHIVHCTLYSVHCTLSSIRPNTADCTLYIAPAGSTPPKKPFTPCNTQLTNKKPDLPEALHYATLNREIMVIIFTDSF